jgi:thermitase
MYVFSMSLVCLFVLIAFDWPAHSEEIIPEAEFPVFLDPDPEPEYPLSSLPEDALPFTPSLPDDFVIGEILVKFKERVKPDNPGLYDLKNEVAAEYVHTHDRINVHLFKAKKAKGKEDTLKAVEKFQRHPLVEYAEPNGIVSASYMPNDPYLEQGYQYGLFHIRAPEAWDYYNLLTPGDVIAILDTGVNYNHPDLSGKVVFAREKFGNCINPGSLPMDDDYVTKGHGTAVAGIAAATGNNSVGITGTAYKEKILPVKVLAANGKGTWDQIICGINLTLPISKAKIMNMSLGGSGGSQTLYDAIYSAWANYGKIVVVAQGNTNSDDNGGNDPSYPACYSLNGIAISVGATDWNDYHYQYSKVNNCITVSAPGDLIFTTKYDPTKGLLTYSYFAGTSFAAPFVSGTAAMAFSYDTSRTNNSIRDLLSGTAVDLGAYGWDSSFGYGLIDAYRAVKGY